MSWFYNRIVGIFILFLSKSIIPFNIVLKERLTLIDSKISEIVIFEVPEELLKGIILMEDRRFFDHKGFDFYSIIRAFRNNLQKKPIQGASTIEQQLIRTIINERDISYKRKFREIILATTVSNKYTKKKLLSVYISTYQFGNCKGLNELCKKEGYNLFNLTIYDTAELVSRIKYPSVNSSNYIRYLKRVRTTIIKLQQ